MSTRRQLIVSLVKLDNEIEARRNEEVIELEEQRENIVEALYGEPSLDEYQEVLSELDE